MDSSSTVQFDQKVLDELEKWVKSKGGKVQSKLLGEFYSKNSINKSALQDKLHLLHDCSTSKVHLVASSSSSNPTIEFLELKQLGSKPLLKRSGSGGSGGNTTTLNSANGNNNSGNNTNSHHRGTNSPSHLQGKIIEQQPTRTLDSVALPKFGTTTNGNVEYAFVRDPLQVRKQLKAWESLEPMAFDFKGDIRRDGRFALIQISTIDEQVMMIDMVDNPKMPEESGLKDYLEDSSKIKVILDCARTVEALRWLWGIEVANVFDLSRAYLVIKHGQAPSSSENESASLVEMIKEMEIPFVRVAKPDETWFKRPLTTMQIDYACQGVIHNVVLYHKIHSSATSMGLLDVCIAESQKHALSLKDAQSFDRDNRDWICTSCSFENFARRYTCKKCNATRAANAIRINPPSGSTASSKTNLGKSTPVSGSAVASPSPTSAVQRSTSASSSTSTNTTTPKKSLNNNNINATPIIIQTPEATTPKVNAGDVEKVEQEALLLAIKLSLQDEQDRAEKARQVQTLEIEAQKKKVDEDRQHREFLLKQQQDETSLQQQQQLWQQQQQQQQALSQQHRVPPSPQQPLAGISILSGIQHSPQQQKQHDAFKQVMFGSSIPFQQQAQFLDTSSSTSSLLFNPDVIPSQPTSFLPSIDLGLYNGSSSQQMQHQHQQQQPQQQHQTHLQGSYSPFGGVDPRFTFTPATTTLAGSSVNGNDGLAFGGLPALPQTGFFNAGTISGEHNSFMHRFPGSEKSVPNMINSAPVASRLSEDETLLLTLDATSLVEAVGLEQGWIGTIVNCAVSVGARCELIEAPLPLFAKSLEQSGMILSQRTMVLKELHSRKNKGRS